MKELLYSIYNYLFGEYVLDGEYVDCSIMNDDEYNIFNQQLYDNMKRYIWTHDSPNQSLIKIPRQTPKFICDAIIDEFNIMDMCVEHNKQNGNHDTDVLGHYTLLNICEGDNYEEFENSTMKPSDIVSNDSFVPIDGLTDQIDNCVTYYIVINTSSEYYGKVVNHFSTPFGDDISIIELDDLRQFKHHITDSLLYSNCYRNRDFIIDRNDMYKFRDH